MTTNNTNTTTFIFFAALGTLLIVAIVIVMLWVQNLFPGGSAASGNSAIFSFTSGRRVKLDAPTMAAKELPQAETSTTAASEPATESSSNLDAVIAAINKGGCTACHTIPNIPGAVGQVGPNLSNIGVDAANRRPGYTAQEYIRESLQEPNAFTAPECPFGPCPPGAMPQLQLDTNEIEVIVNYLTTLGVSN